MPESEILMRERGTVPGGIAIGVICVVIFGLSQLHGQRLRAIELSLRDHSELKLAERIATLEAHRINDDLTDRELLQEAANLRTMIDNHRMEGKP